MQAQTWDNLLFAHWRVDEVQLRALVPESVELDTFDGSAWLGMTPFRVNGFRVRGVPPLPLVSSFLELNVRTYVTVDDKPGIWFFSLDCESQLAVEGARRLYKLPYFHATMSCTRFGDRFVYESSRRDTSEDTFVWDGRYGPAGEVSNAEPGSLEWFLTERYCLYTTDEQRELKRADIHHPPWPLQPARADIELNTMAPPGVTLPDEEPLVHFSARQDVVIWSLEDARA